MWFVIVISVLFGLQSCVPLGESRYGTIISFEPPDLNDWVDEVLVKETDVISSHKNGKMVRDPKLDLYSMRLEQYCYESSEVPQITQSQWYDPPKMECKAGHYYVLKLQYNEFNIDCLRVTTTYKLEALDSIKPIVIKRFYLKVYYLTTTGDCYVKNFELPVRRGCSASGHIKLPTRKCEEVFPFLSDIYVESSDDYVDEVNVKTV